MSEGKHTPGPWLAVGEDGKFLAHKTEWTADFEGDDDKGISTITPILAGDETIALVVINGWREDELEANARLIAAAPDILEALRMAREELSNGIESEGPLEAEHSKSARSLIARIDAAIAKAEGNDQ